MPMTRTKRPSGPELHKAIAAAPDKWRVGQLVLESSTRFVTYDGRVIRLTRRQVYGIARLIWLNGLTGAQYRPKRMHWRTVDGLTEAGILTAWDAPTASGWREFAPGVFQPKV